MGPVFGEEKDLDRWMRLVTDVRAGFPGLETEEALADHRRTVLKFMGKRQALCVRDGDRVAGVLLFSRSRNMICCLAVDPAFRRRGIASALLEKALGELDRSREITVSTFREGDEKGTAPRALYRRFGFEEGELTVEFGYPNQVFRLPPGKTGTGPERKDDRMFTADMIAPCGLDCSLCARALSPDDPCPGCLGPDENKPEFCSLRCGIVLCEKRKANGYRFCDECPDFPCEDVMEKEDRYTAQYPLRESPLENLRDVRELGMDAFLEREKARWTCPDCGSPLCVHTGICSGCGRKFGRQEP